MGGLARARLSPLWCAPERSSLKGSATSACGCFFLQNWTFQAESIKVAASPDARRGIPGRAPFDWSSIPMALRASCNLDLTQHIIASFLRSGIQQKLANIQRKLAYKCPESDHLGRAPNGLRDRRHDGAEKMR
jgi:hypothetical protein